MGLFNYLFSFDGRINRAKMWAFIFVGLAAEAIFGIAIQTTLGFGTIGEVLQEKLTWHDAVGGAPLFFPTMAALYVILVYIHLAIVTKRLHDRDKSMWWLLVFVALPVLLEIPILFEFPKYIAYFGEVMNAAKNHLPPPPQPEQSPLATLCNGGVSIIGIWAFVELYILKGTEGTNRFGPDPLVGR
jgi:uncharacterized membrane protein YhaH (DUF805 family)